MKIITCLKEVPDRDTRYKIDAAGTSINQEDLTFSINECDEYALEESLKLKEKHGGEVVILTLGREKAERSVRKGLAMGADRAILVKDDAEQINNPHAVAQVLAQVLREEEYDLILAGTQSDDLSYAQTGVILAELLGLSHATIVMEIEAESKTRKVKALREMESGWFQWVEMSMPTVLTVQAGISQVRYVSLRGIMQARKKEIHKIDLVDLNIEFDTIPSIEVVRLYFPEVETRAEVLEGEPQEVVEELVKRLKTDRKVL